MLYRIQGTKARPMTEVAATSEAADLHDILRYNLDLLPGDQISPDDPRRWLLVANEAPVADPETGSDRWSLDMLVGDQDAIPTLVEVKRAGDPRAKREVVAQMLDYAANGHYYWEASTLLHSCRRLAEEVGADSDELVRALGNHENAEQYFDAYVDNLREGQVRLVFFLERAPRGLASIVEFLNRQMERTEVLVVEARLYESDGQRFVQPRLFGYTEEARRAKRRVQIERGASRQTWNEHNFLQELEQLPEAAAISGKALAEELRSAGFAPGTSRAKYPTLNWYADGRAYLTQTADNGIWVIPGWANPLRSSKQFRKGIYEGLQQGFAVDRPDLLEKDWIKLANDIVIGKEEQFAVLMRSLRDHALAESTSDLKPRAAE